MIVNGIPDKTFGNKGITRVFLGKWFAAGRKIAIQQDGKIVVTGDVGKPDSGYSNRSPGTPSDPVLFRLNSAGRVDKNFNATRT